MEQKKPVVQLTGQDGNVFNLAGIVSKALRRAGMQAEAKEFMQRLIECKSYDEALVLMMRYVDVK